VEVTSCEDVTQNSAEEMASRVIESNKRARLSHALGHQVADRNPCTSVALLLPINGAEFLLTHIWPETNATSKFVRTFC
jgi:hypothetical protein